MKTKDNKRVLFCRVGWMRKYKGCIDNDRPVGGGKYTKEHEGHEAYNFFSCNNGYYGYVQPGNAKKNEEERYASKIAIEKLGVGKKDKSIAGITVIWVAKKPSGGQFIVGWYKNATVYREMRTVPQDVIKERGSSVHDKYNVVSADVHLLNESQRDYRIKGMGRSNLWYGNDSVINDVLAYISKHETKQENIITPVEKGLENLKGYDKEAVVKRRVNQSSFRERLLEKYKKCCLCDVDDPHLLIASHIKPWSESNSDEKLDEDNGFLLCPAHDKLFDMGYISFDEKGFILISDSLSNENRKRLGLHKDMRISVTKSNIEYIQYHRNHLFKG